MKFIIQLLMLSKTMQEACFQYPFHALILTPGASLELGLCRTDRTATTLNFMSL